MPRSQVFILFVPLIFPEIFSHDPGPQVALLKRQRDSTETELRKTRGEMQAQHAERAQLQNDEEQKLRRLQEELRQVGMGGWGDDGGWGMMGDGGMGGCDLTDLIDLTNSKFAKT